MNTCIACSSASVITKSNVSLCSFCGYERYSLEDDISGASYEESSKYQNYHAGKPVMMWYHLRVISHISKLLKDHSAARILDVGCHDGYFVAEMHSLGFDAYGEDWNKSAVSYGRSKYNLGSRLSDQTSGKFDLVIATEVIEHVEDPIKFIEYLSSRCTENGFVILSLPNKNSFYRPKTDYPPHHLSRFTPLSIKMMQESNGLKVIYHEEEMDLFQAIRNFIGDRFLKSKELSTSIRSDARFNARRFLNLVSPFIRSGFYPINKLMYVLGFRYISQVIVCQKQTKKF